MKNRMEESPTAQARSRAATPRVSDELANLGKLLVFPGIRLEMLEAGNGGNNMHAAQEDGISTCFSRRRVGGPEGDLEDPGGGEVEAAAQVDRETLNGEAEPVTNGGARLKTNGSLMNNSSRGRSSSGELRLDMGRESTVSFHARDQLPTVVDGRSPVMDERSTVVDGRSTVIDGRLPVVDRWSMVVDERSPVMDGVPNLVDERSTVMEERSMVIENLPNIGMNIASRGLATPNLRIQHVDHRQGMEPSTSITGEVN